MRNYYNVSFFIIIMTQTTQTTNISELPIANPSINNGNIGNNISLNINEMNTTQEQPIMKQSHPIQQHSCMSLDQETINQIINGLQNASASGATLLSSRDIPQDTTIITNDPNITPNHIPRTAKHVSFDYIKENEDTNDIINNYNNQYNINNNLENLYDELQTPLLLCIMYFLFQLPIIKKKLFIYFPIIFSNDGNLNLYGFIFMSILFGLLYFIINKSLVQFNKF